MTTRAEQKKMEMVLTVAISMSGIEENIANDIASNLSEFQFIKDNPKGYHDSLSNDKRTNSYLYGYLYGLYKANAITDKQMGCLQEVVDVLF